MFLLDTNVISELRRPGKAHRNVAAWASSIPAASFFISVISILEIELGARLIERKDTTQGAILRAWIDNHILARFEDRILAIDAAVAQRCAQLHVPNPRAERGALIAATAFVHGLTIVTRNVGDFEPTGAPLLNPWGDA
ncbi:type II toxin-antitoxin system VapC family toxin [Bradyrhizobium zhanjiangense]|uniref:Type II toxin-antitoxin system VapC family toxin n=1 Tax=Bradyrhizobium zhanjiangense TaxID=1325107 RepID=A0ABY0DS33_9BRAD|nr:type II toxin-antitoxin system VapC family toxin [Bradyrhizobium zhanjiangense]RXG99045.1 type II toxin-antitoxin system VapC family toxin [Bradyrhizobium zhanjiangense]